MSFFAVYFCHRQPSLFVRPVIRIRMYSFSSWPVRYCVRNPFVECVWDQFFRIKLPGLAVGGTNLNSSESIESLGVFSINISSADRCVVLCFFSSCINSNLFTNELIVILHAFISCRLDYCNAVYFGLRLLGFVSFETMMLISNRTPAGVAIHHLCSSSAPLASSCQQHQQPWPSKPSIWLRHNRQAKIAGIRSHLDRNMMWWPLR